ncbi:MAG: stage II sporulation protein R [Acutalibacteraceae bacterium]|nr:stage II sporulation protein R [Acutalibacteraceae bacterium]
MIKKIFSRRGAELSAVVGLLCAIFASMAHFEAACDDLRQNVLRLHIIANSDSEEDQAVKLLVRDKILEESTDIFAGETDLKRAEEKAAERLNEFCETAEKVLRENGFSYGASAGIGDSYFETREYEDFTLPAGNYRSLIIRLGKAQGKNWWCVIFPAVCVPAATDASLSDSTRDTSAQIAEHPQKYVMRFKTVEIYEDIKKFLKNK